MRSVNAAADADPACLRLSVDTQASVVPGDYSRGGQARGFEAVRALDHGLAPKAKRVPVGILEVASGELDLTLASSTKTSDLLADRLAAWWQRRGPALGHVKELVVNADNGPESHGKRSQFLARLRHFADQSGLRSRLVYYPPSHRKHNPIERCRGALERPWKGTLLSPAETALRWAQTMTWKGLTPVVRCHRQTLPKRRASNRESQKRPRSASATLANPAVVRYPHPPIALIVFTASSPR